MYINNTNMIKNLENEIWKNIPNSNYAISNLGRLKCLSYIRLHNINKTYYTTKEHLIKPSNNNSKKYWRKQIAYLDGKKVNESIHRLVALAFVPNPENKPQVNHIDGDKNNNKWTNLEWATNQENNEHKFKILKVFPKIPIKNKSRKLTEEQVKQIPTLLKTMNQKEIAKLFNVGHTTIVEITRGRSWRHLNLFEIRKNKREKYFGLRYSPILEEISEK